MTSIDHDDPIEEVFEDQLACADLVVLSKSDLVPAAALADIETRLPGLLRPGVAYRPLARRAGARRC